MEVYTRKSSSIYVRNGPISSTEIQNVIGNANLGKAPGPDRFSAKYFKTFKEELILILQILINEIIRTEEIPSSWKDENTTLIPKEGQDQKNVNNYRPISLLNNDYKLNARILAERLKCFYKNI